MKYDTTVKITIPHVGEWKQLRALRLEALKSEPHAFKKSYEEEVMFSEGEWKQKLRQFP